MISMMHKLGMFKLRINYGVKMISDYLFNFANQTLDCFVDSNDEANASRYYESNQCRMIAETVLRATFNSMMIHDDLDSAIMYAIQSITYNALDLTLLPVLYERYIQRILQFEPLLGVATLGLLIGIPVVSVKSMLQLMDGKPVTDQDDAIVIKQFILRCLDNNNDSNNDASSSSSVQMLPYMGTDEYCNPTGKLPGYVTCNRLKEICAGNPMNNNGGSGSGRGGGGFQQMQSGGGGGGGASDSASGGSIFSTISPNGVPMQPIVTICKRIYSTNQKTLMNCAFVKDFLGFQRYFDSCLFFAYHFCSALCIETMCVQFKIGHCFMFFLRLSFLLCTLH